MRFITFTHRFKRQVLSRVQLVRIMFVILLLVVSISAWYFVFRPFSQIHLPDHSGRTNFLILGVGGGTHDGPDLTDTIIFASLNLSNRTVDLISFPRDLWVPTLQSKINSAYHLGVAKKDTVSGLLLAKSSVSEISNQPVDYAILIDFSTFTKAIDLVGGIDLTIDRSFDDFEYPIAGRENDLCGGDPQYKCRYEQLHFNKGLAHMNGETALKFARSRHSTDLKEGTDFARSTRQSKVIAAFKQKLFSKSLITHPKIYQQLYELAKTSVITDIPKDYYPVLVKLGLQLKNTPLTTSSISDLLYNPPISEKYASQWILLPKDNNPSVIYDFVSSKLK